MCDVNGTPVRFAPQVLTVRGMGSKRVWPLGAGRIVTSPFGPRWGTNHWGVDFGAPGGSAGLPVYAAQGGFVDMVGPASGFGQWVVLDHPDGDGAGTTVYGHVIPEVRQNQRVEAGQRIARINPDQNTNGGVVPHLHFEVHRSVWVEPGPDRLDPLVWLDDATEPENVGGSMPDQFVCDVTLLSPNDDGQRNPHDCRLSIVHTNEGKGSVEGLLSYLARRDVQASYTIVVGRDGRTGRSNDDNYIPWAAGSPANEIGLHLCFIGFAAQTRAEWLSYPDQLAAGARVLRDWSDRYDIPLDKLSGAQMHAGQSGVGGHADTVDAWHSTDHHDPGPGFPYDVVLHLAREGGPTIPEEGPDMTPEQAKMLEVVHAELTKKFPSRSKLRASNDAIDTMAGFTLNADARAHELSVQVPIALERLQKSLDELPARIAAALRSTTLP